MGALWSFFLSRSLSFAHTPCHSLFSSLTCSCLSMPLLSPSLTFKLFLSTSSHSKPPHNAISDFLLNECGLCSSQISKVFQRFPALLRTRSPHTAREAVQLLRDSAFTENQLHKTIVGYPNILGHTVNGRLKPKMEFMKTLGFTPQALATLISSKPRLLSFSLENSLRPKIPDLKNLFGSNVNLCRALTVAPGILGSDIEKQLKPKVEYVKNYMGISEGSKIFVYALKAVLSNRPESLERKVKNMASLGFLDDEIHQMLKKSPGVLTFSIKKVQDNMDFLIHTAGLVRGTIVSNTVLLNLSVEKRLKPRYEIFKSISSKPHSKDLPSLSAMFLITEKEFHQKFIQSQWSHN